MGYISFKYVIPSLNAAFLLPHEFFLLITPLKEFIKYSSSFSLIFFISSKFDNLFIASTVFDINTLNCFIVLFSLPSSLIRELLKKDISL